MAPGLEALFEHPCADGLHEQVVGDFDEVIGVGFLEAQLFNDLLEKEPAFRGLCSQRLRSREIRMLSAYVPAFYELLEPHS